ncbi:uncharacterized protein LOC111895677 [Lactuca sativa]|uniref:uncharacterized protein LOC111895677 n=1 Tax=Lactuca sativa TaxID=4236 RepID=UPI000CCA75B1|nr:uncharacterized protein LOC111895677 [Lactuca sativa]
MDSNKQTFVEQDSEMKQNLTSETKKKKRKRGSKGTWEAKSKDKQIVSNKPKKASGKGKRTKVCDIYNDAEDQYMCMERAAILLERLDAKSPKFAKCMLPSNVLYSFWLILPKKFCVMHLPDNDTTVILVDESGKEFKTNYLKVRHGLSAGWRGFSIAQRLLQGDILFFHLVEPCKLQVNIVRRYGVEAIEAAVCLMEMHPRAKKTRTSNYFDKAVDSKKEKLKHKKVKEEEENKVENEIQVHVQTKKGKRTRRSPKKFIRKLSLDFCSNQEHVEEDVERGSCVDQCDNISDELTSEVVQGSMSEMTTQTQPDEIGSCALNLNLGYLEDTIDRRIFHSSTVAT